MLNKWALLGWTLIGTLILCLLDFFIVLPYGGFLLYNLISLACGIAFISIGSLLKDKKMDRDFAEIVIVAGVIMAFWHVINILIGVCV